MRKLQFDTKQDQWFYDNGFLVLREGEAYERRMTNHTSVFVTWNGKRWVVSRYNAFRDEDKVLAEPRTLRHAVQRAQEYIRWYEQNVVGNKHAAAV
jgi:hypothetical protein